MLNFFEESTPDNQQTPEPQGDDLQDTDTPEAAPETTGENQTDETADTSQEETTPDTETVSLKINDRDYEVNLPKDIAQVAKNGILMQADYTKGKQKLSDDSKALASRQAEFDQALTDMHSLLEFERKQLDSDEMKQLQDEYPGEYLERINQFNARVESYNKHLETQKAEQTKAHEARVSAEIKKYTEVIPSWLDEKVKDADMKMMVDYLTENGFEREQMASMYPANIMKCIRDAALYNKTMKSVESNKHKAPPKTLKQGTQKVKPASEMSLQDILRSQQGE